MEAQKEFTILVGKGIFVKCVHDEPLNGGVTFRDANLTRLAALLLLDSFVFIVCHSLIRCHVVRFFVFRGTFSCFRLQVARTVAALRCRPSKHTVTSAFMPKA